MKQLIHVAMAYLITAPAALREKKERGGVTIEQVIWIGGLAILAIAIVTAIVGIANGWLAKIPT